MTNFIKLNTKPCDYLHSMPTLINLDTVIEVRAGLVYEYNGGIRSHPSLKGARLYFNFLDSDGQNAYTNVVEELEDVIKLIEQEKLK